MGHKQIYHPETLYHTSSPGAHFGLSVLWYHPSHSPSWVQYFPPTSHSFSPSKEVGCINNVKAEVIVGWNSFYQESLCELPMYIRFFLLSWVHFIKSSKIVFLSQWQLCVLEIEVHNVREAWWAGQYFYFWSLHFFVIFCLPILNLFKHRLHSMIRYCFVWVEYPFWARLK